MKNKRRNKAYKSATDVAATLDQSFRRVQYTHTFVGHSVFSSQYHHSRSIFVLFVCLLICLCESVYACFTFTKPYSLNLLILMANSVIHLGIQYLTIDLSLSLSCSRLYEISHIWNRTVYRECVAHVCGWHTQLNG